MAKVAVSIRLGENQEVKDLISGEVLDLENLCDWNELAENVYQATFKPYLSSHEVVLSFCEPEEIKKLNSMYRNYNEVTDVLSFNSIGNLAEDLSKFEDLLEETESDSQDSCLGDVVICMSKTQQQAKLSGNDLKEDIMMLFVHGVLHLLGYDHGSEIEAKEMFGLQEKILSGSCSIANLK